MFIVNVWLFAFYNSSLIPIIMIPLLLGMGTYHINYNGLRIQHLLHTKTIILVIHSLTAQIVKLTTNIFVQSPF